MPAPAAAVYVGAVVGTLATVAAIVAFKEFVYEPHIAPALEAWAENFLERRRQRARRRRAAPHTANAADGEDENQARRSSDPFADPRRSDDGSDDGNGAMSVELEQLVSQERNSWRSDNVNFTLRQRRRNGALDESTPFVPYSPMSPTHVIFDSSVPPSPTTASEVSSPRSSLHTSVRSSPQVSRQSSLRSPAPPPAPVQSLAASRSPDPPAPRVISPRLPTPMSYYAPSPRVQTPAMSSVGSPATLRSNSRALTPEGNVPASMYNTAQDIAEARPPRAFSPFSDAVSNSTFSSGFGSPDVHSPVMSISDIDMPSDDEFDVLSPRSGMFSPPTSNVGVDQAPQQAYIGFATFRPDHATVREDPLDVRSQHGSEGSWASIGRRTPE